MKFNSLIKYIIIFFVCFVYFVVNKLNKFKPTAFNLVGKRVRSMKDQSIQISLFYCSNSLQAEDLGIICRKIKDIKIISIGLPCSGKVNLLYLLKAVETGSDGVLLVSCRLSDCKYLS
jgi:hypothetical protein